jgi:hypothetical protein
MPVADSAVMRFQDEIAFACKPYDRVHTRTALRRIDQEDPLPSSGYFADPEISK